MQKWFASFKFYIESATLKRARKSNGSLTPSRPDKEYPPHVPRDYQIKNSKTQ